MLQTWLCQRLPWHRWVIRKQLSEQASKLTCSCGREYAVHHFMGAILPWDEQFADMYARFDRHRLALTNGVRDDG